jgi:hypothetical protein
MLPAGTPATMNTRNILTRRVPPRGNDHGADAGGGAGEGNEGQLAGKNPSGGARIVPPENNPFNGVATLAEAGIDWRLRPGASSSPSGACDKVLR